MTSPTTNVVEPGAEDDAAARPRKPTAHHEPTTSTQHPRAAADAAFISALESVDAFLAAQNRLALTMREAHHALSRAKYAIAASGGGVAAATLPLRRPLPPPGGEDGDAEVRAERWVVERAGSGEGDAEGANDCFELRAGPVPRRQQQQQQQQRRQGDKDRGGDGGGLLSTAARGTGDSSTTPPNYDDPRSPPPSCPESVARADAARLRWAGASGALPPPALREAQARFGDALRAAVASASAARAAVLRAERARRANG
jgi:hypothetical protein